MVAAQERESTGGEEREGLKSKGGGGDYLARAGGNPNSLSGDILCALARSRFSRNLSPRGL